jgi:hypothetical protein
LGGVAKRFDGLAKDAGSNSQVPAPNIELIKMLDVDVIWTACEVR